MLASGERQRAGRANSCAHRGAAGTGAVIAHVALHHLVDLSKVFRHAEGASHYTIRASDAARLQRTLHYAIRRFLDGVSGTHLSADGIFTVHADLRRGLNAVLTLDDLKMDH